MKAKQKFLREGWCVWITGLPGSGKSVISRAFLDLIRDLGHNAQIVSSDMLRKVITPSPKYTEEERNMVYAAIVFVTELLVENGINVIIDATGNRRRYRDKAREKFASFVEVYLKCPLEICTQREMKRGRRFYAPEEVYGKALRGESSTVPGMGAPYEEPLHPEVTVESDRMKPKDCAKEILNYMRDLNYI